MCLQGRLLDYNGINVVVIIYRAFRLHDCCGKKGDVDVLVSQKLF